MLDCKVGERENGRLGYWEMGEDSKSKYTVKATHAYH